jgi:hypothetical protein
MAVPIHDLNTFFVAMAPASDAQKLSDKNPVVKSGAIHETNFADGKTTLYDRDYVPRSSAVLRTPGTC